MTKTILILAIVAAFMIGTSMSFVISEAEANGELTIQKTDNVVNAPMVVWRLDGMNIEHQ